ncbi:hypothetical protein [Ruficoccus sp. ZRK36]|uniref:hypothetical protein n=1 Tax=Ruficoccus sp. ZRK36 TaxID=2866311 RepID=UPI001C72DCAE|nr:hypothetical protein [Ruficoccus sp. ZRK36]QYY34795.1 hypothetical protein K0V07_10840 [Ruficoccus sp. ZRK36]QYY37289.1 hypothetical protein K0V07_07340 [Ruficoccus sp. ZRK36]
MTKIKTNLITTPYHLISHMEKGPALTPVSQEFWAAYACVQQGKVRQAQDILSGLYITEEGYPIDSSRIRRISAHSEGRHCGADELDLADMLASARLTDALKDLFHAGRIAAIHAIHAEIEMSPPLVPNPLLKASREDMQALIELYEIEAGVLEYSIHNTENLMRWLTRRNARARYYDEVLDFCHSYADGLESESTPTDQAEEAEETDQTTD